MAIPDELQAWLDAGHSNFITMPDYSKDWVWPPTHLYFSRDYIIRHYEYVSSPVQRIIPVSAIVVSYDDRHPLSWMEKFRDAGLHGSIKYRDYSKYVLEVYDGDPPTE